MEEGVRQQRRSVSFVSLRAFPNQYLPRFVASTFVGLGAAGTGKPLAVTNVLNVNPCPRERLVGAREDELAASVPGKHVYPDGSEWLEHPCFLFDSRRLSV